MNRRYRDGHRHRIGANAIGKYLADQRRAGIRFAHSCGGGCSGLSYVLDVEEAAREHHIEAFANASVDPKSMIFLSGLGVSTSLASWKRASVRNPKRRKPAAAGKLQYAMDGRPALPKATCARSGSAASDREHSGDFQNSASIYRLRRGSVASRSTTFVNDAYRTRARQRRAGI
jgi:Fe-S cluster assembly iron-binding protein IscA